MRTAEAAGLRISRATVARRHRLGLIQSPQRHFWGRGLGSESIYPWGTAAQLVASELLVKKFGTDYQRIGWLLWIEGFPVGPQYWREPLERACIAFNDAVKRFSDRSQGGEPLLSDMAMDAIEAVIKSRNKLSTTGLLRRTLHQAGFETLLRALTEVAIGTYIPSHLQLEPDTQQAFAMGRALGTRSAKNKRKHTALPEFGRIEFREFEDMLKHVGNKISKIKSNQLAVISENEIIEARSELTLLLNFFCSIEQVQRQVYGRSSQFLRLLVSIVRDLNVTRHAHMLFFWILVRRIPAVGRGAKQFLDEVYHQPNFDLPVMY
ncbi:MAG: hypothetical protein ACLQJ0_20795 [Steroidobacteraceae bacterium]